MRGVKISLRYIDPGVKISYDILTPGSIYRGVKISSHTGNVTIMTAMYHYDGSVTIMTVWFDSDSICLMMTSWNGNIFRVTSPLWGESPHYGLVTRSFDVFFDVLLNKWLWKQSRCWWFETRSCSFWRHCNTKTKNQIIQCRTICFVWLIEFCCHLGVGFDVFTHRGWSNVYASANEVIIGYIIIWRQFYAKLLS